MVEKKLEVISIRRTAREEYLSEETKREKIRSIIFEVLKCLLKHHEEIKVTLSQGDKTTVYWIDLQQQDFGRLVGAKGKNIQALRIVVSGMAAALGFRAVVQIYDEDRFF